MHVHIFLEWYAVLVDGGSVQGRDVHKESNSSYHDDQFCSDPHFLDGSRAFLVVENLILMSYDYSCSLMLSTILLPNHITLAPCARKQSVLSVMKAGLRLPWASCTWLTASSRRHSGSTFLEPVRSLLLAALFLGQPCSSIFSIIGPHSCQGFHLRRRHIHSKRKFNVCCNCHPSRWRLLCQSWNLWWLSVRRRNCVRRGQRQKSDG